MTGRRCTIEGIVTPSEWDEGHNVKGVTICASDEKEYRVRPDERGRALLPRLRQFLRVTGMLTEEGRERPLITVESYEEASPPAGGDLRVLDEGTRDRA